VGNGRVKGGEWGGGPRENKRQMRGRDFKKRRFNMLPGPKKGFEKTTRGGIWEKKKKDGNKGPRHYAWGQKYKVYFATKCTVGITSSMEENVPKKHLKKRRKETWGKSNYRTTQRKTRLTALLFHLQRGEPGKKKEKKSDRSLPHLPRRWSTRRNLKPHQPQKGVEIQGRR